MYMGTFLLKQFSNLLQIWRNLAVENQTFTQKMWIKKNNNLWSKTQGSFDKPSSQVKKKKPVLKFPPLIVFSTSFRAHVIIALFHANNTFKDILLPVIEVIHLTPPDTLKTVPTVWY